MDGMKLGQGQGRPRKVPQPPSYDDFPVRAPPEEIEQYLRAKKTQKWHYDVLTSSKAAEHHMEENILAIKSAMRRQRVQQARMMKTGLFCPSPSSLLEA